MKRISIIVLVIAATLSANAQLEVRSNGQVWAGNSSATTLPKLDSTSSMVIWGQEDAHGGIITFGDSRYVAVGESGYANTDVLFLRGSKGIAYEAFTSNNLASKIVFSYNPASNKFAFNCPVSSSSFLTTSDARLKTDISSLDDSWKSLADLNSVRYRINLPVKTVSDNDSVAKIDSKANSMTEETEDMGVSYGFIAQEVQEVYPELVRADEEGMLAIDYTGFIPLLVDAVKNLTAKVEEQEETIAMLTDNVNPSRKQSSVNGVEAEKTILMPNRPNPFNSATSIECILPETVKEAFLCIYDLQGKQIRHIDLTERGRVSTVIDASSLQPGMYIYALIADGSEIDSKRMILTD